jgi:uncharacterized protein (TIGR03437 family)
MTRHLSTILLGSLLCAAANAATINTTMTVRGSGALTGTTFTGTADLTGIGTGLALAGTFSTSQTGSFLATFVITVNAADKINVTLTIPATILTGSATASGVVTGGTGTYAGATGTFSSMPGSGSLAGTTLTLTFSGAGTIVTAGTGGGGGQTGPVVTEVLDAGSYSKNIAQGSIFVVKGTGLSAAGFTQLGFPLPTTRDGVKITFTPVAGGAGTDAYLVYLYNQSGVNQLAAVLPSTVAPGNYNVTVTNGTASAPVAVQVVQRKLGLITADSSGSGLAVIQNYVSTTQLDIDRFTTFSSSGFTFSPSKPGQVLIAWATGMGPVTGGDNIASPGFDFNANGVTVRVIVGGVSITPLYAGRAPGLAGADQINYQLPANIPTGCTVSFQVSVNGVLSNPSFIAIAPDTGATACVQQGYTSDQLRNFDNGGTYTTGAFALTQFQLTVPQFGTVKSSSIGGAFTKFSGFQLASGSQGNVNTIQQGSCQVTTATTTGTDTATGSVTYLDAGNVTVTGPAGSSLSNTTVTKTVTGASRPQGPVIAYGLTTFEGVSIPGQANFSLPAGTYTINGAGGTDVNAFNASITIGPPLTITGGLPTTVNRANPLTINWTGGNASDLVEIVGGGSTTTGSGASAVTTSTSFVCLTTAGQRTFTVPASVLGLLPASTANNPGLLEVASGVISNFQAQLKPSGALDLGVMTSFVGTGATPTYQ